MYTHTFWLCGLFVFTVCVCVRATTSFTDGSVWFWGRNAHASDSHIHTPGAWDENRWKVWDKKRDKYGQNRGKGRCVGGQKRLWLKIKNVKVEIKYMRERKREMDHNEKWTSLTEWLNMESRVSPPSECVCVCVIWETEFIRTETYTHNTSAQAQMTTKQIGEV